MTSSQEKGIGARLLRRAAHTITIPGDEAQMARWGNR